jgi:hypothetical protein
METGQDPGGLPDPGGPDFFRSRVEIIMGLTRWDFSCILTYFIHEIKLHIITTSVL